MSEEINNIMMNMCLTPNDANEIFIYLMQQYNRNEIAEINVEELEVLNNIANELEKLFLEQNVIFNKENFILLMKRLYPNDIMLGGDGDEIIDYTNVSGNKKIFNKNDFFGILYFLSGFVLVLLSFIRINEALKNVTGTNSAQIAQNMMDSIQTSTTGLSLHQLGILKYMYQMFVNICNNFYVNQKEAASQQMMTILWTSVIPEYYETILKTCGFPDMKDATLTNFNGVLKILDYGASVLTNAATLNTCVTQQAIYWSEYKAKALPLTIFINISTITALFSTGSSLIIYYGSYLSNRIKTIINDINNSTITPTTYPTIENNFTNTFDDAQDGGRKRKRKTRKIKRSRTKKNSKKRGKRGKKTFKSKRK
jgi:hypothetical protein